MDQGLETSTFAGPGYTPDLDTLGNSLDDDEAIVQDLLRGITEQIGVLFWAPRATLNVSLALQMGMTDADISALESAIQELYADDPRYESTTTKTALVASLLTVQISAVTISGQRITLKVSDDGTRLEYERLT
jgi:hypothetical protein